MRASRARAPSSPYSGPVRLGVETFTRFTVQCTRGQISDPTELFELSHCIWKHAQVGEQKDATCAQHLAHERPGVGLDVKDARNKYAGL